MALKREDIFLLLLSATSHKMHIKNIIVYHFAVVVPVAVIFFLTLTNTINSNWFVYTFCFYLFVYRTYTDGKRLADKGLIEKKDIWKMIIPGKRIRFFKDLYLR